MYGGASQREEFVVRDDTIHRTTQRYPQNPSKGEQTRDLVYVWFRTFLSRAHLSYLF